MDHFEIIKRFTHEIVNYLMKFHFTIHTYISEFDTKFRSLRYVKIEVNFSVYSTWTNDLGHEIIKRFTHSEIVNYLMKFPFHYSHI